MGGTEKRDKDKKIFKKGGQAGSRGGCLKKVGGAGTPLRIMLCGWSLKNFTAFNPHASSLKKKKNAASLLDLGSWRVHTMITLQ